MARTHCKISLPSFIAGVMMLLVAVPVHAQLSFPGDTTAPTEDSNKQWSAQQETADHAWETYQQERRQRQNQPLNCNNLLSTILSLSGQSTAYQALATTRHRQWDTYWNASLATFTQTRREKRDQFDRELTLTLIKIDTRADTDNKKFAAVDFKRRVRLALANHRDTTDQATETFLKELRVVRDARQDSFQTATLLGQSGLDILSDIDNSPLASCSSRNPDAGAAQGALRAYFATQRQKLQASWWPFTQLAQAIQKLDDDRKSAIRQADEKLSQDLQEAGRTFGAVIE